MKVFGMMRKKEQVFSVFHPPSQEATVSRPWRNAGVLRSLLTAIASATAIGEGGLELRRVAPHQRCHGLLPVGLHDTFRDSLLAPDLGTVEGGYAELVGQDLPGNPPFLIS